MHKGNKSQIHDHVITVFAPSPEDPRPPELVIILACVAALQPDLEFTLLDEEEDDLPAYLSVLPSVEYASWDGSAPGSLGYGGVNIVNTSHGAGLYIYAGGSSMSGASGFYILPSAAVAL